MQVVDDLPATKHVAGGNHFRVAVRIVRGRVLLVAALDKSDQRRLGRGRTELQPDVRLRRNHGPLAAGPVLVGAIRIHRSRAARRPAACAGRVLGRLHGRVYWGAPAQVVAGGRPRRGHRLPVPGVGGSDLAGGIGSEGSYCFCMI